MKKQILVRMYAFNLTDIIGSKEFKIDHKYDKAQESKLKEVRTGYNILVDSYYTYNKIELENDMLLEDIFKLALPEDEDRALRMCKEGITFRGVKYVGWFASTGMMKKEDYNEESKVEMLFIREDKKDFRDYFENLITLGKVETLNGKEIKICKDYLSRLSLSTSTAYKINYQPKIIVLPELEYPHVANYKSTELIDNKIVLKSHKDYCNPQVFMDGGGIMSNNMADVITEQLELDYKADYCIFRYYAGLACKGGLIRVDFNKFFDTYYAQDTETFKKTATGYKILDAFGEWQTTEDADIIVNESCVKWAKHWKKQSDKQKEFGMKEVKSAINALTDEEKQLVDNLYITKINKKEINKLALANYQLLGNLAITPQEIGQLSSYTENIYSKILNDDIDTLKLFLNDIVGQDANEDIELVPSTKIKALLNINEEFIKLGYVKKNKARLINKKVRELCGGKFWIKADWKYMIADPITFLWTIMNDNNKKVVYAPFSLKEEQFYISGSDKQKLVLERCPLNCYNELRKIETTTNRVYEEYMPQCKELIIFNQADNLRLDGDFDGDICLVIDEPTIYNSVVTAKDKELGKYYFINFDDDKSKAVEMEFNEENRYIATCRAGGNDICKLANFGSILSDVSTQLYYIGAESGEEYTYDEAKETIKECDDFKEQYELAKKIKDDNERNEVTKQINLDVYNALVDSVENGELIPMWEELEYKKIKLYMARNLKAHTDLGFYLLRLQQLGIDKAKTLKCIPETELQYINKMFKGYKKPYFLKYLKDIEGYKIEYRLNPININARRIATTLYREDVEKMETENRAEILYPYFEYQLTDDELNRFNECKMSLKEIYDTHNAEHNSIRMSWWMDKEEKGIKYKLLDAETTLLCKEVEEKYGLDFIGFACVREKISENFIINFLWNTLLSKLNSTAKTETIAFRLDENGEYEYLGNHYIKEVVAYANNENLQSDQIKRAYKVMTGFSAETRVKIENKNAIHENMKLDVVVEEENEKVVVNLYGQGVKVAQVFDDKLQVTDTVNIKNLEKVALVSIKQFAKTGKSATVVITA